MTSTPARPVAIPSTPTTNKALSALRRELLDLAEKAREVAGLCDCNSMLPHMTAERLAYQVRVLGVVEDRMLSVASAITAFEQAAGVRVDPSPPDPAPVSEVRAARFNKATRAAGRSRGAG